MGMLLEEEIMELYSELIPTVPKESKRRTYYRTYKQTVCQSETAEQGHQRRHTDRVHKASVKQAETHEQTVHR